jgi:rsbT antagonist protein RsbS
MQVSRNVVVASIQVDLDDDVLTRFEEDLLGRVHETSSRAVFLDVSGLETLDSTEFEALRRIIAAVTIMGTESILVGLQPGVVSALIEVGANVDGLRTAVDLDAAFELLEPEPEPDPNGEAITAESDVLQEFTIMESEQILEDEQ